MPSAPHLYEHKIFRGSRAVARGRLTRDELRSSAWQNLFRDVYADARMERTHRLMCLAVAAFVLPAGAAIAGRSAAHLFGVPYVDGGDPVEVLAPRTFGPVKGVTVHTGQFIDADLTRLDERCVTTPERTCWDLARWHETVEAGVFVDAMARRGLVTKQALTCYARERVAMRGQALLKVIDVMDPQAESPQESRLRVRLIQAGLPAPVAQFVITRGGVFVARADLAWEEQKVAVEYDGRRWHTGAAQLERDRHRLNRVLGADWLVFHVTADQMRDRFDELVAEIRSALRRRSRSTHRPISGK